MRTRLRRWTGTAFVLAVASMTGGCAAILGDFTPAPSVDAGRDGIEGSASDAASSDATLPARDGSVDASMDADAGKLDGSTLADGASDARSGATDAADTGALTCSVGETMCGASCVGPYCPCVYEKSDPSNCGACGNVCGAPATSCVDGGCACPDAGTMCDFRCTNLQTDSQNCGRCGNQCGANGDPNKNCVKGGCTCSPGC